MTGGSVTSEVRCRLRLISRSAPHAWHGKLLRHSPHRAVTWALTWFWPIDATGGDDVVIEINPRLTTSYVGLRAATRDNLAAAMLNVAEGRTPELMFAIERLEFTSDGKVQKPVVYDLTLDAMKPAGKSSVMTVPTLALDVGGAEFEDRQWRRFRG